MTGVALKGEKETSPIKCIFRDRPVRSTADNGLTGDYVRIEERDRKEVVFYGGKQIRSIPHDQPELDTMLQAGREDRALRGRNPSA